MNDTHIRAELFTCIKYLAGTSHSLFSQQRWLSLQLEKTRNHLTTPLFQRHQELKLIWLCTVLTTVGISRAKHVCVPYIAVNYFRKIYLQCKTVNTEGDTESPTQR